MRTLFYQPTRVITIFNLFLLFSIGWGGFTSCQSAAKSEGFFNDIYAGLLPCADCEGIAYHLYLFDDGTFRAESLYLGKAKTPAIDEGRYTVENDTILHLNTTQLPPQQFERVSDSTLTLLTEDGQRQEGALADNYELLRTNEAYVSLAFQNWQLTRLDSLDIKSIAPEALPNLHFLAKGTVNGYTGCNRLFGGYTLEGEKLNFLQLATTRRFCGGGSDSSLSPTILETTFLSLIDGTCTYSLDGETLELTNSEQGLQATFQRFH